MTGLQLAKVAEHLPASTRVGGFRHGSSHVQGVGEFDLWKVDNPRGLGLEEALLVTDSVGDRPQTVIGLREMGTGDPIVELVQTDSGLLDLNHDPRALPKVLGSAMVAVGVRRLRIGGEMTNIDGSVLAPAVSADPSDKDSSLPVFPPNQPAPSELPKLSERAKRVRVESLKPVPLKPLEVLNELDAEAEERAKAKAQAAADTTKPPVSGQEDRAPEALAA